MLMHTLQCISTWISPRTRFVFGSLPLAAARKIFTLLWGHYTDVHNVLRMSFHCFLFCKILMGNISDKIPWNCRKRNLCWLYYHQSKRHIKTSLLYLRKIWRLRVKVTRNSDNFHRCLSMWNVFSAAWQRSPAGFRRSTCPLLAKKLMSFHSSSKAAAVCQVQTRCAPTCVHLLLHWRQCKGCIFFMVITVIIATTF